MTFTHLLAPAGNDAVLVLPAGNAAEIERDLAAVPLVGWFRTVADWAADGRPVGTTAELGNLLGFDGWAAEDRAALVDIAVRWALGARLIRLRIGVLRTAKQNVGWLADPAVLWFRALGALERPDDLFTSLLAEYGAGRVPYDLDWALGEFVGCLAADTLDSDGLVAAYHRHIDLDRNSFPQVRMLGLLARALGLVAVDHNAASRTWTITGLGRVFHTLRRLPFHAAAREDDEAAALSLVGQPDDTPEPVIVVKVVLSRHRVWRRLRVPGELTLHGLHLAIETSFGWNGDHLHVFSAGPFRFAPSDFDLDDAVPSELVTMTDLTALGIRDLVYRYDLGDCWDHGISIETNPADSGNRVIECVAGVGTTPAEDGQDWYEDDDGQMIRDPAPAGARAFDPVRINRALAALIAGVDED